MGSPERDPYTGHMTTGHEWNGIRELNTPVPKVVIGFLGAAFLFALGYWYFMPAWPLGDRYSRGSLGIDQRTEIAEELAEAEVARADWKESMEAADFALIRADARLMDIVRESGPALYRDNCSMCHGSNGEGGRYFPRLNDDAWLWSDDPDGIVHTLRVGINADHPETRVARMPAFGDTGALTSAEIDDVVLYLLSRSNAQIGSGTTASELLAVNRGARVYEGQCIACHGADMHGNPALGAPNLADDFWLYGGDESALRATIVHGRGGHMPAWESRLDLAERKVLALHVLSLSAGGASGDSARPAAGNR